MKRTRLPALALSAILAVACVAAAQDDTAASMERAKRLYRTGDYRAAIEELTKVVELDPSRADAWYLIGYSHVMLRQFDQSVEAFGRAFEADPTFDPRTIFQRRAEEPTESI